MPDYIDPFPGRKGSERVTITCWQCEGTGLYRAPSRITDQSGRKYCFQCDGKGSTSVLVSSARARARRAAARAEQQQVHADEFAVKNDRAAAELAMHSPAFAQAWQDRELLDPYGASQHEAALEAMIQHRDGASVQDALDTFDYWIRRRYLPELHGPNRFGKPCHVCGRPVPAGAGRLATNHDRPRVGPYWATYCSEHVPHEVQNR